MKGHILSSQYVGVSITSGPLSLVLFCLKRYHGQKVQVLVTAVTLHALPISLLHTSVSLQLEFLLKWQDRSRSKVLTSTFYLQNYVFVFDIFHHSPI